MRVVLAGQRSFGRAALEVVREVADVVGVVAPLDDKLAREAARLGLVVFERASPEVVRRTQADLLVAAHSHSFIGRRTRAELKLGAIGYHPSLLPRHRGRDAVVWTVKMGDPVAGGSAYWLTDNVDGGPIAAQDWCFVDPAWDASDLWREELFPMGLRLLAQAVRDVEAGVVVEVPQDERFATWEPAFGAPPLHRPELPELGGRHGYAHVARVASRGALAPGR